MDFLFFLFYQSSVLSSHAEDGHQMYFGGSVVGKASTISIGISPNPPIIFTGGVKKCKIWHHLKPSGGTSTLDQAHGHLPSSKASLPVGWYQITLLGDRDTRVSTSCLRLLHSSAQPESNQQCMMQPHTIIYDVKSLQHGALVFTVEEGTLVHMENIRSKRVVSVDFVFISHINVDKLSKRLVNDQLKQTSVTQCKAIL